MTTMDQSTENPANIRGVCFCCLADGSFKNMYQSFKWLEHSEVYADMMLNCYNINIGDVARDTKPLICEVCIVRLRDSLAFRKQVENSCEVMKNATSLPETNVFELPIQKWEGDEEDDSFNWDESEAREESASGELFDPGDLLVSMTKSSTKRKSSKAKRIKKEKLAKSERKKRDKTVLTVEKKNDLTEKDERTNLAELTNKKSRGLVVDCARMAVFKWKLNRYVCVVCQNKYLDIAQFQEHVTIHDDGKLRNAVVELSIPDQLFFLDVSTVTCTLCGEIYKQLNEFKQHVGDVHCVDVDVQEKESWGSVIPFLVENKSFRCNACDETFLHFLRLNQHINKHYANYICPNCGAGFIAQHRLTKHIRRVHLIGEFPCKSCDEIFTNIGKLQYHVVKAHKSPVRARCPHCSLALPSFEAKMRHLTKVHNEEGNRYKCEYCRRGYMTAGLLSSHVSRVHLKEKNHVCETCGRGFLTPARLRDHMVKHTGERKFVCDLCKKTYPRYNTLKEHMKIHYDIRNHSCPVCNRKFIQKATLKVHMNVHKKARNKCKK